MLMKFPSRKFSIRVFSAGRFGNQLFQLAAALTVFDNLKYRNDCKSSPSMYWYGFSPEIEKICKILAVPIEFRRNSVIERLIAGPKLLSGRSFWVRATYGLWWRFKKLGANVFSSTEECLDFRNIKKYKIVLTGYFHDYRIAQTLINRCKDAELIGKLLLDLQISHQEILRDDFIGVHLRFGDYLLPDNKNALGEIGFEYFNRAIELLTSTNQKILIFSDDPSAAEAKLSDREGLELEFAKDYCDDFFQEFILLCFMNRKILSNSTFSWWAGYFSQDNCEIVAPDPLSLEQIQGLAKSPNFIYLKNAY